MLNRKEFLGKRIFMVSLRHKSEKPIQQNRLRVTLVAVVVAGLALFTSGCADNGSAEESTDVNGASGDQTEEVNIGYFPLVHTSTIVNAMEQGYLEENGISAELIQTQGGAQAIPALNSGDVDLTYANYTSALLARQQGLPIVLIAGNDIGIDDHGIYVDPDAGIETIADLEGKRFAVNDFQNIGTVAIYAQLEEAGLEPDDIEIIELAYQDMAAAVQNGNVDAVWQVEPFQAVAEEAGLEKLGNLFAGPAAEMPVAGWITTEEYAEQNPEVIQGLRDSLALSIDDLQDNRDLMVELVPEFTTVTGETVEQIELPTFTAELDSERLQRGADMMYEYGIISEELDVDAATLD
jgi:NitT/TauT family transport system substrate-binding protein